MGGRAGRGERKAGEGVLDVSIRPGAVKFSTGKVATVGLVKRGKGGEKHPPSPPRLPSPAAPGALREELLLLLQDWWARKRDAKRPLFEPFLIPSAFCPGTHKKVSLFLPCVSSFFSRLLSATLRPER